MKTATLKTISQGDGASLYTIYFVGEQDTEFDKFIKKFKDNATLNKDYQTILYALEKIVDKGAWERLFRPEGRMNDNIVALSLDSHRLRLYCLRISDQILIVGNGGEKRVRTYQDSEELSGYVMDLQQFDLLLSAAQKDGSIKIEQNIIIGIENKTFEL